MRSDDVHLGLKTASLLSSVSLTGNEALIRPCFTPPCARGWGVLLAMFRDNGELVMPRTVARDMPDSDDAKFVHCAETAQVE
jgi:hypothetical protein